MAPACLCFGPSAGSRWHGELFALVRGLKQSAGTARAQGAAAAIARALRHSERAALLQDEPSRLFVGHSVQRELC